MFERPKKYIISGAPGTGKTTLINLLKKTFPCMEEVARKVIIEEQKNGNNGTPWQNIDRFTDLVFNSTVQEMRHSEAVVCDRSLLDLEAYLTTAQQKIPIYLKGYDYHDTYHKTVFFAPTWYAIYCKDGQRLQEFDYCEKLEKVLREIYRQKGFVLIELPKVSPSKRVEYILSILN